MKSLKRSCGFTTICILLLAISLGACSQEVGTPSVIDPLQTEQHPPPIASIIPQGGQQDELVVTVYLIALEDAGARGSEIGCGDSVVKWQTAYIPTGEETSLSLGIKALLSIRQQQADGLYNALANSNLTLDSSEIAPDGKATIRLSGQIQLGGACDNPRFEAQLRETALQLPEVQTVEIYLNGTLLKEVLSDRG